MSNVVIVAIPAEDDYVNKISSEKIAHMTLLFLGETSQVKNLSSILGFVLHASNQSLNRFGMEVDRRAELGPDQADTLLFSKSKWSGFDTINQFRSYLLKEPNIRMAYDSAEQFPEWIPHLTLGYPPTPAKEDTRDYPGISYVNFDRIAVWFGDYEGFEFPLKTQEWSSVMAMSSGEDAIADILEHHGTKGMKWGIRKESSGGSDRKIARQDRKFAKRVTNPNKNLSLKIQLNNSADMQPHIDRINAKYAKAISNGTLLNQHDPTTKKYYKEFSDAYLGEVNKAAKSLGTNASGTREYAIAPNDRDFFGFTVYVKDVKHADADDSFRVEFVRDSEGKIVDLVLAEDSLEQSALFVQDILDVNGTLSHHGVKGMHWGIRKETHPDIAHIPRKTRKEASKDAEEFTRAKLYFGKGAGTRRKLIKAKVETKKAKDPLYAKAFDHFVKQTDLAKRAEQAKSQRKRTDTKDYTKKTAKGVGHVIRGNTQYANTSAQVGVGVGKFLLKNLKQSGIDDTIEHHGVKGMKWGVRRKATVGAQEVIVSDRRKKLKTTGGQGHPSHSDAIKARTSGQIARKSGTKALSNAELKAFNERLNLEQNFKRLQYEDSSAGRKFVLKALKQTGNQTSQDLGSEGAKQVKRVIRLAATAAAA